jgi:hypothetical protein
VATRRLFGNGEPAETSLDDDGSLQNPSGTSGRLPQSTNTIKNKSTDMNGNDLWDDLLGRDQVLVPVVGPDLTVVKVGDAEQTLTTFIGQRLAEKFHSAKRHRHHHIHTPFAHLHTCFFLPGSGGGSTKQIEIALSQGADFQIELTSGG